MIQKALPECLHTDRLRLRPFQFSDVPEFHGYVNDPEMWLFLEGESTHFSEADASKIIARHLLADTTQRNVWAITIENAVVGAISITFRKNHRVSEVGYSIARPHWRQGLAREALGAVVDAAFEAYPQLQRIQANIHPDNEGSIRVARAVGMEYEGTLRCYAFVRGTVSDEDVYSIIRDKWQLEAGKGAAV